MSKKEETTERKAVDPASANNNAIDKSDLRFQEIQSRAYVLWQEAGRPEGDSQKEHFWYLAEKEVSALHAGD